MALTPEEQEKYRIMAEVEEEPAGTSLPGESYHGEEAAEMGREIIKQAKDS